MKNRTSVSGPSGIEDLVAATLGHMRGQRYSAGYLRLCHGVWREFLEFLGGSSVKGFSEDDIIRYLESRGICSDPSGLSDRKRLIRAVMRILAEFKLHGCYQRRRCMPKKIKLSGSFQAVLNN